MKLHNDEIRLTRALEAIKRAKSALETATTTSVVRGRELEHKRALIDERYMAERSQRLARYVMQKGPWG